MHYFRTVAAFMVIALLPGIAAAASWTPATASWVHGGITSNSTFAIAAGVTLASSCDVARIRTATVTSQLHRSFIVEQMPGPSTCKGKPVYNCTVMSQNFRLPIQHKFEVETKGKAVEVALGMEAPQTVPPMCAKP